MGRIANILLAGLLWGLTACLGTVEALLAFSWFQGMRYIAAFGRAENPYAAEDAEIAGICAAYLLPFLLASLACAAAYHKAQKRKRTQNQKRD